MKTLIVLITLVGLTLAAPPLFAHEHEWLTKFVGEWEVVSEGPAVKGNAVMKSSMLGKLWLGELPQLLRHTKP